MLAKVELTHLPLDKMAAILADDNFECNLLNENDRMPIQISLKFVPRSPIDNKPALVQLMAWRQAITWTNADPVYWRIYAALGGDELSTVRNASLILCGLQISYHPPVTIFF